MPWLDDLKRLRVRVDNEGYGKQMADVAERRTLLERFAVELTVEGMLGEMNDVLLDGGARLIVDRSWQYDFDDDDDRVDGDDELADEIVYTLYWHDGEPVEIEVRVGIDDEDAGYVIVEDEEVDDDTESIQNALSAAFRDIADMD
jgi:hypothetical protein